MITYAELVAMLVFVGMGLYISYLRNELRKSIRAGAMLTMVLHDITTNEVQIERTEDGIRIYKHEPDREASTNKC